MEKVGHASTSSSNRIFIVSLKMDNEVMPIDNTYLQQQKLAEVVNGILI